MLAVKREHHEATEPIFNQAEYDMLRKHYFGSVEVFNVELPGGRTLRKQTKPPRIEQKSRGFKALRKRIKSLEKQNDHMSIVRLLRQLQQWEMCPPSLSGGVLPAALRGEDSLTNESQVQQEIDLTDDDLIVDVDSFICEVLLVSVTTVKLEDGQQKRTKITAPAPFILPVKQEVAPGIFVTATPTAGMIAEKAEASSIPEIQVLDLSNTGLTAATAVAAIDEIMSKATKGRNLQLNLSDNNLASEEGGMCLSTALKAHRGLPLTALDLSNNDLSNNDGVTQFGADGTGFFREISKGLSDSAALTSLDISNNNLGQLVPPSTLPAGWYGPYDDHYFADPNGEETQTPPGSMPLGVIALANAIPDMGALTKLVLKDNRLLTKEAGKAPLAKALAGNSTLKELDVSSNNWEDDYGHWVGNGPDFAQELAAGICVNGALSFLNMANNNLGELVPPEGWTIVNKGNKYHQRYVHIDGREQKEDPGSKPEGIVALANAIPDMGALTILNISWNELFNDADQGAFVGKVLGGMLQTNSTLRELDVSNSMVVSNSPGGPRFAQELAVGIRDNGAMTKLDISKNGIMPEGGKALAKGLKGNQVMTELNIAGNELTLNASHTAYDDMSGVTAVANTISGMGALSIANVLGNRIGKEMLSQLQEIMRSKPMLISLCGIADDATEADLSDGIMDADDAIVLASELPDKGALTSLNLASNDLGGYEDKAGYFSATPEGITTLYCAYPTYCFSYCC
jgi:Leucine-rich repeat (LRR) protein